ncbi:MAG: RluA family pseudouridine synthase [Eubacteriaceae bacterium]|jgi:23S rRNA pseudouridine1911/1915/1917 synthase|nr:RluA family pseudouridine synthase [Eubacteriaceae bacterium]
MPIEYAYTIQSGFSGSYGEYLRKCHSFSSRTIRSIKKDGALYANGKPVWLSAKASIGDEIVALLPEERSEYEAQSIPISIIYEDRDVLIVNKHSGIVVHPTRSTISGTLTNAVLGHWEATGFIGKVRFANRLDRDTSGVIAIAKSAHAHHYIQQAYLNGANAGEKTYIALAHGKPDADFGVVDAPIARSTAESMKRVVTEGAKESVTEYRILNSNENFTLFELKLYTGRTHQIRVHLSHIGCPIVSDGLYGAQNAFEPVNRLALHASSLTIAHPRLEASMSFSAPIPDDMLLGIKSAGLSID